MEWNEIVYNNIDPLQRKLVILKDNIKRTTISKGQAKFINTYLEVINDYIERSLSILDVDKYKEELRDLDI